MAEKKETAQKPKKASTKATAKAGSNKGAKRRKATCQEGYKKANYGTDEKSECTGHCFV